MRKSLLLKILAMSASLALARAVSHFLIYKALIVPQIPFLKSVPLLWWVGAAAPILGVPIAFGYSLKSWRQLIIFAIVAGCLQQFFTYLLASWNEPSYLKAYESAIHHWTVDLATVIIISVILFSMGMLMGKAVKRRTEFA